MPDKTYAKFILNNETYLDLTNDTVDSSSLLSGYTAHDRSGAPITGSFDTSVFVLKSGDTMTGTLNLPTLNFTGTAEEGYENETKVILNKINLSKICTELPDEEPPYPIKLVSTIDNSETMHTNYYGNIARTDLAKRSGVHFNSKVIGEADEENEPPAWESFGESDIILGNEYFNNVYEDDYTGTTLGPFVRPRFSLEYNSGASGSLNLEEEKIDDDDYTYTQKTSYFNKLSYPLFGDAGYTDVILENYDNGSLCISTGSKTEIYNSENPAHENKYYTNYGDIRLTAISPKRFTISNIDSNGYVYRAIEMGDSGSVTSPNGYIRINGTEIRQGLPFLYKIWPDNAVYDNVNYSISANQNLANNDLVKLRTYTCNSANTVSTLTNKPSDLTKPFMMYAMSPVLTTYNTPTSGSTALYMMRKIIDSDGNEWNQAVTGTYGSKTFGSWKKMATMDDLSSYLPLTGGTLTGNLTINHPGGDGSASVGAELTLGNNIEWNQEDSSFGYINLYSTGTYKCSLCTANNITSNKVLYLPNKNGTLAVTSDLDSYVLKTGDSLTGALSFYDGSTLKSKISNTELQVNGHDLLRMTPHFAQTFATLIPANANLNTTTYLKVGQYYCTTTYGFVNSPTSNQFVMEVTAVIYDRYDDESGTADAYRIRKMTDYVGNQFIQYCSKPTNGSWSYGTWNLIATTASFPITTVSERKATSTAFSDTGITLTIPSSGWYIISANVSHNNALPQEIAICQIVTSGSSTYIRQKAYDVLASYSNSISSLATSFTGYFDAGNVLKLYARCSTASTNGNDMVIQAKKLP